MTNETLMQYFVRCGPKSHPSKVLFFEKRVILS